MRNYLINSGYSLLIVLSLTMFANAANIVQVENASVREMGASLYQKNCMSCHGRNLEGAIGPNLVDYKWLHGSEPTTILNNIKNGFAAKGMPPFKYTLSDNEIQTIITYVFSQQRGWRNLKYEVKQLASLVDKDFDYSKLNKIKPMKSGVFNNRLADFGIAEVPYYAITVEGELSIPYGQPIKLYAMGWRDFDLEMEIDGEVNKTKTWQWGSVFDMPAGTHNVRLTYAATAGDNAYQKDFTVLLTDASTKNYVAGLTVTGDALLNQSRLELIASDSAKTSRRRTEGLSGTPIAIGLTNKWNYAFDSRSCHINGLWTGDFIDIGPNLSRRSNNAAVILGDWIFKGGKLITITDQAGNSACRFNYLDESNKQSPSLLFNLNQQAIALNGVAEQDTLKLNYRFLNPTGQVFSLRFPDTNKVLIKYQNKVVNGQTVKVTPTTENAEFSFIFSLVSQ